jgi:molecular chaperone GrpE (heat shock protein)
MADTETSEEPTAEPSAEAEQPKEKTEDPEVTALKSTIAQLESDLKQKKSKLQNLQEMADRYSSSGYARQVALVENNKRMRGANMADTKSASRAAVIQTFLPVMEELDGVSKKYEGDSFASSLGALRTEFYNSLAELGVTEYGAEVGEAVDGGRVVAVQEEHSEDVAKGSVISLLKTGYEIKGNVVRPAECVGSLGSEKEEEEAAPSEEGEAEAEEAAAE